MNENLKPLAELNADQRIFLKQQVGAFASKLGLKITREQSTLDRKLGRREDNKEKIESLNNELQQKQTVLDALKQAGNVSQDIISSQEADVQKAQKELDSLQTGPTTLTEVEAYLEQYEIEVMKLEKQFYEDRFAEVDGLG